MPASVSKKLFAHGGIYGLSRFLNMGLGFVLIPLYAHMIGDEGYGVIDLLGAVAAFLSVIFLQGLNGAWYRLRFDQAKGKELRVFETSVIWYLAVTGILGLAILTLARTPFSRIITPGIPFFPLGFLTALTAFTTMFGMLLERKLQAEQRPVAFAVYNVTRTVLMLGCILLFVAVFERQARGKIEAEAIAAGIMGITALFLLKPGSVTIVSWPKIRNCLAYGLPILPHGLAGLTNNFIDRVFVTSMLGLQANGVYGMGYKVASIGYILATSLNQAFSPMFIDTMKSVEKARSLDNEEEAQTSLNALARAGLQIVAATACVLLALTVVSREVLLVMTTVEFSESWRVVAPVSGGLLAWACYFPFIQSVTYHRKKVRVLPIITIISAMINIIGNYYLIPVFGIMGAAWATVASSCVMALLAYFVGQRITYIPYKTNRWLLLIAWSATALTLCWLIDLYMTNTLWRCLLKAVWLPTIIFVTFKASDVTFSMIRNIITRR